jgi:uncharacterized protein (DUF3820 family)
MATKYTDETPMPWGKYKGHALANIPASYFAWWFNTVLKQKPTMGYDLSLYNYILDCKEVIERDSGEKLKAL